MNPMSLCEECETFPHFYHCKNCQRNLCISCDLRIHEKAESRLHIREQIIAFLERKSEIHSMNAIVFCLMIENAESRQGLLNGIRKTIDEFMVETLFLLVWNENNEKINKLMLEIQLSLTRQKVIVLFMKTGADVEAFFRNLRKEAEKYARISVLAPQRLLQEVRKAGGKGGNFELSVYEDDLLGSGVKENHSLSSVERTAIKKSVMNFDFTETPNKANPTLSQKVATGLELIENQPYKNSTEKLPFSKVIQDFFRSFAKSGLLMLEKIHFLPMLSSKLIESGLCSKMEAPFRIKEAEESKIFHTTIRKFGSEAETFTYISLHLEILSLESLIWVLKSLQIDEMTPTEKVILSRIKESFCLKLSQEEWKSILGFILANPEKTARIRREKDPENPENYLLFLAWEKWVCSDKARPYSEIDQSNWDEFLDFLRSFFFNPISAKISFKSVENLLEKQEGRKKYAYFNKKFLKTFIPGGKYGCCQFIKCCGTPHLKTLSFGKLSLFVQEALDRGLIEYYKTLLIATEKLKVKRILLSESKAEPLSPKLSPNTFVNEKNKIQARDKIREVLIRVLSGFPQGVNLSRLPKIIHFYLSVPFDCQEFGFKKLKEFLMTFEEIELFELGDNIVARLRAFTGDRGKGESKFEDPYSIYRSSGFNNHYK